MNVKLILASLLALPMMACSQAELSNPPQTSSGKPREQVMCTMEVKQCPDGSWAGRSGPTCEFKCPSAQ